MEKQTGTGETVMRSSSTRPSSCANCAQQGYPSLGSFGSSPKTGIATSSSRKSLDALCSRQNECNRQDLPGAGPRGFWDNWGRCFPRCMRRVGSGAIASRRTFLFIAAPCDSSISREHATSIRPSYCHGVRRITPRLRLSANSSAEREPGRMITHSA